MAESVSAVEEKFGNALEPLKKIAFSWTTAADGTATGTTTNAYVGEVIRLVTVPGTAGSQPTDQYDIVINDEDTTDVLMGAGANRSNASTEQVLASSLGCVANDKLTLEITNAGDTKSGTVYLYIR